MESPPQKRIGGTPISGNLIESNNESNNKWDINKSMGARRYITMINNNKGNKNNNKTNKQKNKNKNASACLWFYCLVLPIFSFHLRER